MTYCNEKQMPCEWAQIGGGCSVSACRKVLLTPGGWPTPTKQPEFVKPPMTNADHIRAMSDEELAVMFAMLRADLRRLDAPVRPYSGRDVNDNYDWLQQPAEEVST